MEAPVVAAPPRRGRPPKPTIELPADLGTVVLLPDDVAERFHFARKSRSEDGKRLVFLLNPHISKKRQESPRGPIVLECPAAPPYDDMQIVDHTAKRMRHWSYIVAFQAFNGGRVGFHWLATCLKCAEQGKVSIFSKENTSARAHVAAARHEGSLSGFETWGSVFAELLEQMVALAYWPVHVVEHPIVRRYLGGHLGKDHLNGMVRRLGALVETEISRQIALEPWIAMLSDSWTHFGWSFFGLVAMGRRSVWFLDAVTPREATHTAPVMAIAAQEVMARYEIDPSKVMVWATDCASVEVATVNCTGIEHEACLCHLSATAGRLFGREIKKIPGSPWKLIKSHQASRKNSPKYLQVMDDLLKGPQGEAFALYDPAISSWKPRRPAISVSTRWLTHFGLAYTVHVFRPVDEFYARSYGGPCLPPLLYAFNGFMLRFLKVMHDGMLQLEVARLSVVFDAIAFVFIVRSRVMAIAEELAGDAEFINWQELWMHAHPGEEPLAIFRAAACAYGEGLFHRLDAYESSSQMMSRLIAALMLNPRRRWQTVLALAPGQPCVDRWAAGALAWIRLTMHRLGGGPAAAQAHAPAPGGFWDVGMEARPVGDEFDAFQAARGTLRIDMDADVGEWWEGMAPSYPYLAGVVQQLRVIPISTTVLERFFSRARGVLEYQMGASHDETIRERLLLFLNQEIAEGVMKAHPELHKSGRLVLDELLAAV